MRILFLILFLFFFFSSTSSSTADVIQQACKATRFPEKCKAQMAQSAHFTYQPSPLQIIQSAISISRQNLKSAQSKLRRILATSTGNRNVTQVAETCLEVLGYSDIRSSAAKIALSRAKVKNARAFFTAALAYQYDCWGGLKYVSDAVAIRQTMSFLNDTVIISTSNALSMVVAVDVIGPELGSWFPPRTERDGFWETGSGSNSGFRKWSFGSTSGLKPNVTVCKEGCDYTTVQKAVEAAPVNLVGTRRFVIHIKEGVYEEVVRIGFEKKNLVFLGDGIGKTVITGSLNTGLQGITTYKTATVGVLGDGFMARGLTIQNTAGANAHQAVAFRSDSDLSLIENCEFLGNQDTLYVHSLRQYFKSCQIQGNIDFIMGNAAVIFENCTLLIRPRQESPGNSETNCIAAHGRTDPAESTGFVFLNCLINGTDEYMKLFHTNPAVHNNYLGRPWKEFSRIVFIDCLLEKLINPVGWLHWDGDFALKTLYFGEFGNKGLGANLSKRVSWSSLIPAQHVDAYSLQNFLLG